MATIKVPEETWAQVKIIADHTGRSSHWVMLEAIKQYVADAQKAIEDEKAWLQSGDIRQIHIPFGKSGYSALYTVQDMIEIVGILRVNQQREDRY